MLPRNPSACVLLLGGLAALLAQGCERRWSVVEQSIADDPVELFEAAALHREEEVFRWQVALDPEARAWTVANGGELRREGREMVLSSPVAGPAMERAADLPAVGVDVIEVKLSNLRVGKVAVEWRAGAEGDEPLTGRLEATSSHPYHANMKIYRFAVGSHPAWRDTVRSVTVSTDSAAGHRIGVRYVRGLAQRLDGERLTEALAVPWRVQLGDETRSAWLTPPGRPHRWQVTPPAGARMRFSVGLAGARPAAHDFVLRLASAEGAAVDPPVELLRQSLAEARWLTDEVDLTAYAGQPVTLELSSEGRNEGGEDRTSGGKPERLTTLPWWGHPQILSREGDPRHNVVILLVDTLRADRLSLHGHSRETSPVVDAWAAGGAVFEHAVAAAPWTLPAHVSLFTGLDAPRHGVSYNNDRLSDQLTLAEILRREGWATEAVTGGGFLGPQYGLGRGFEAHWAWNARRRQDEELEGGIERALTRLARLQDRPFLLFFHTYEVHSPFTPRAPWFEEFSGQVEPPGTLRTQGLPTRADNGFRTRYRFTLGDDRRALAADENHLPGDLYDSAVAYTDQQIGRLLQGLEDLDLADNTLVILTSDHGEMLGEDGLASHAYLRPENLRVPLILVPPHRRWAGRRVAEMVRGVDLTPTVLEFLGLDIPTGLDGTSLLPLIDGDRSQAPRAAWSYAGSTNQGLAVEVRGRQPLILQDSPWQAAADSREASPADLAPELSPGEREALRAWGEKRLREDPVGLFVTFRNDSPEKVRGRLVAEQFTQVGLKVLGFDAAPVRWINRKNLGFEIPPGAAYELVFRRRLRGDSLRLMVTRDRRETAFEFPLAELAESSAHVTLDDGGWRRTDGNGETPPLAEIILRWQGAGDAAAPAVDDELGAQLRALGYID
ncbi:MAG: sulfatase [Acidobacteriota bacterium]